MQKFVQEKQRIGQNHEKKNFHSLMHTSFRRKRKPLIILDYSYAVKFTNFADQIAEMKKWLTVFFFITPLILSAQQKILIQTVTDKGTPVGFATLIIKAKKNTPDLYRITDSTGSSTVSLYKGEYTLTIQRIGYYPIDQKINIPTADSIIQIELKIDSRPMQEIVVTARKPLLRQEDDKTIVDPEPIAQGTTNAYEVMERIPGVFMDQDGNIYLNSTSPSAIWINGREQRMSTADVATILKSLPPNSIDRIEIVRTPSARYDASGGGGIVNVILKKNVKIGLTGSVNAGVNQGKYGNQFAGFNLNNSNGKKSFSLNVNVSSRNSFEELQTDRIIQTDSLMRQRSQTLYPGTSAYTGFVFTNELSPKWEISTDSRISFNWSKNNTNTNSGLQKTTNNIAYLSNLTDVANNGENINFAQGINLKYKIDSSGSEWVNDLSYNYSSNTNDQHIFNQFVMPVSINQTVTGDVHNTSSFITFQSNLVKKFKAKFTLEAGIKSSNLLFDNKTNYFLLQNNQQLKDNRRSNAYRYYENIHSAYIQGAKTFGKFILKSGVRFENTNMEGQQNFPGDTSFTVHRTDAFPYVYFSRSLVSIAGFELRGYLVYRRSISRPSFGNLNPAIRIIDPFAYETGNPSLRPQFTQNFEANISVDERPLFAVGINQTKDIFSQVVYPSDSNRNIVLRTYDNLGKNKETYFRIIGAIPPGKKYFFVVGVQYNHNLYNGQYEGSPLNFNRGSWTGFTYHNLKLSKTTQLSLNGFIRLKGQLQFYELGNFGQLNINLSQQFFRKKMTATVGLSDLFYTNWNSFYLNQGSLTANGFRKADTRRIALTIRYNFGIRKKEEKNMFDMMPSE